VHLDLPSRPDYPQDEAFRKKKMAEEIKKQRQAKFLGWARNHAKHFDDKQL